MPDPGRTNPELGSHLNILLNSASLYITQGVAPSTLKSYVSAWSWFTKFCFSFRIPILPILISTICAFVVHCFESRNLKIATIRKLLAGIQFHARFHNPNYPSIFSTPAIRLLLKGIEKSAQKTPDKCLPITLNLLHRLTSSLSNSSFCEYINILLEAVFLSAFYGFMRLGEFASDSKIFNPARGLCLSDLRFSSSSFNLFIKYSKADSSGTGVTITISKINFFCPYTSMVRYLKARPRTPKNSPLFILPNRLPMTKQWFRTHLASVLTLCDLSPHLYTGHSFCIGAATTAAECGVPDSTIQMLGRWSSTAYKIYIRSDKQILLNAQQALSTYNQGS
ncbi:uncharacterized protein LOC125260190 [Megalobrama amblycephala]|uniref:uncharacterized protein LOC125260190 n=1 Tax=Megalobrama amblycephala TaxID=75352 RepID=UPI002013F993|nr:uncharacterized protein LOC125260190 [Megalobrama amblycephala]